MSSTRSCGSSSSSSNGNSNMPARRTNSSRRTSESSSSQQLSSTTTSTTSSSTARQQHVADKSAVKRKKRRKDEDEQQQQRAPVVLLTRLEDERKSNECKVKRVTEVKVVVERACDIESIRAPALVAGKKSTRHPVHRSSENLANGDAKATEPIRQEVEKKVVAIVVVEDTVKAPPKKSIESAKSSESRSSKVKSDRKPADRSAERNVHNVNNDNNRKTIDPKITERRLLVKLDRSEVQNYLAKRRVQRLHAEEKEVVDKSEIDKYHSESENQDDDVASKMSTEIKTCAITSDDGEIQDNSVEKTPVDDVTDRFKEMQKTDATDKVKEVQKPDVTDKVKEVQKTDATNRVKKVQKPDVTGKVKEVQKTDVTNRVKEVQKTDVEKPAVESAVKKRGRPRKDKNVEEPAKSVVKNQRLSSSREKRKAKSQDAARKSNKADSDKDLRDNTKIHEDSSVQVTENQTERLDESPKDTSCESAKSSLSSESLNESAVVDSEQVSSETPETYKISNKIIESNSGSDNDSSVVAAAKPVPLPMKVDEVPHERTVVDDSKAESESAQQICDIHSKNVDENAETLPEEAETVDKSMEEVLPEPSTENLVDSKSSESPLENLVSSDITECPAKSSEQDETCESPAKNLQASETSENLVNSEVESPADSFVICENAESTNEESMSGENNEMIETLEDTESIASTCTLIEETPEELSKELEAQEELPEDVEKPTEEPADEDAHKEPESIKELSQKEDDAATDTSLKTDKLDESFSSDDKAETNEHESTFENNLKSVENLVIDSILNGEIVSPKMIVQSAASRVEQSFVFEGGVEDFVNDMEATKAVSLQPSTPIEEVPSLAERLEPSAVVEAPTVASSVPIKESTVVESSVPLEEPAETLPVEPLPSVEQSEPTAEEETLESPPVTEEATIEDISEPAAPTEEPPVDEEFAKHRRKHALSELKKKCEENIDRRQTLEEACNDKADREEEQQPPPPSTFNVENHSDVGDLQVPSSELVSSDCYPEPTAVRSDNYFENISEADSEICLADRLNQLTDLKIPSLEETLPSEKSVTSDVEESSPSDHTKRQRILMKITKTDVNKHVTHLVESKEEENNEQFAADQVTEGEIKIIMRKESSSNNHVIKEIKIIPRTPEGNNSARIPGYSPTSSDLSSGNSSCRVPSCSPAKPDSGSYRMPGWSPASTETGQTTTTATTKKKQGRPKKYPIFTDAELIAKTTAIVNNVDVHAASKLADKPLFEPVESIRINEDHEVEQDDDDEEEHQTIITEQTCLSGSQLLDAMPAQPEIAAELTRKIEENQSAVKKKKGRPRKYPLLGDVVGTKSENVSVARIEFNVVDSIEEFVEPVKQIAVSPVKKRGRPRKYPLESAETSGIEESDSIVESVLIHEVPSDKKARQSRLFGQDGDANSSMAEDVERTSRKPFNTLKDLLNKSPEIQPADDTDSQTEDEAPVVEPYVERRGRKPRKHLKDLKRADDQDNSTTENEVASDASPTKPYVERRGRKPWKHLKELNKLSESQVAENLTTENEAASDASPVKPYVERRGRKPWKHLKDPNALGENQVADDADSQTEDEAPVVAPYVERRGRKPWKHLKNLDKSLENQSAQQDMSTTENDAASDASLTKVERRGRKPKHLKNLNKSTENQVTEDADSQTEDEAPVAAPYVERRGRKSWKHLKNLDKSSENQVTEDADSQTEDEAPATAPYVERRGRKPWKHLKHANESSENQVAEQENSTAENNASPIKVERRGRKLKDANKSSESQDAEETNSQTEDETIQDNLETDQTAKKRRRRKSQKLAELSAAEGATSMTEDEFADDTLYTEKVNAAEKTSSMTENESADGTAEAKPYVERRGRKPKHLKDPNKSTENQVDEGADSQTEDEAPVAAPNVERRGRKPSKHVKNLDNSSESQATEQDMSATETDIVSDASPIKVERRGRPRKKGRLLLPNGEKRKRGRPRLYPRLTENQAAEETNSLTLQDVQTAAEASSINEDGPVSDNTTVEPVVQEKETPSEPSQDNEAAISENIVTEEPALNTENEIGSDTPLAEVIVKKKRGRKPLKHSEDTAVTSVAEEANSMTEDESADEDALVGEQSVVADKPPVVSSPEKRKRGRPPKVRPEAEVSLPENQSTEEASSMTEDDGVPAVEPIVKKGGKPRKYSQDETIPEIPAVAQDASPVTEDEIVSSTEDIPTSDSLVQKRAKSVSPIKIAKNQVLEQPSSQTEDETVSSTEDIPAVEQQPQQQQPIVKKVKFAKLPHTSDSSSTPSGSSVEDSTMEPPVVARKRGRPPKIAPQADSTNDSVDNTTEDETVSSTDDVPTGEQHVAKKKQGRPKKNLFLPSFEMETMNNSLAASSVEDLSTFELPAPKKRGRKPHPRSLDGDENSSIAASSMEDLSAVEAPIVKKKRGRKPRALVQNDSAYSDSIAASSMEDLSMLIRPPILLKKRGRPPKIPRIPIAGYVSADSMEEFSPMQQMLSPAKQRKQLEKFAATFGHSIFDANQQNAHDRSLSPVKKRGRPPKYPRENVEAPKRVSIVENPEIISTPTIEQQPPVLEKRKGRLPRRLSQDENILPSIIRGDKLMARRASHDSGIIPAFSLSDGGEVVPSLGKRQGRPPRKFSPDEEHSFSAIPQPIVNHVQIENESPKKLGRPPIRKDDGLPMSQSPVSDSDETSSGASVPKRRGRPPKKFALEDTFMSGGETSPTKRRGRPPKSLQDANLPLPRPESETKVPPQDVSLSPVVPCVLSSSNDVKKTPTISTTNLLRQQRKPKMAQPQPVPPPVIVQSVPQLNEPPPAPPSPVKKRGRPRLLPTFDIGAKLQPGELPDGMTIEQLRRRRHSQDDSMFATEVMPAMLSARPKEFEDAQPRKKRGRPPKVREVMPQPFVLEPVKQVPTAEVVAQVASVEDSPKLKERLIRPQKASQEKTVAAVEEPTTKLTAADFLRTWTDRDDSPAPQTAQQQPTKKPGTRQRRFSQDFTLDESSRPSSRNRLRRYSQGDVLDDTSNDELRYNARKRLRSSGSDSSIVQDEKRPRVERDLCDQHSITKELVVQLTKIDKGDESPTTPCQQPQLPLPMSSDLVRMNLRRKLESNNSASEPPPLVPIEPNRLQPPTHSDAKLLMLMQPSEDKTTTILQTTPQQAMQPPTQQFCIIFIPDALTSSESSLSKDSQPTATIVNFQPVPDSELANKSVIYTPTTPTKIFVNNSVEEQQRHRSFLCATCTQALDFVSRLEANMGMTEEDKCAIKCPFCSNAFQSVFYLEYHLRQEHLKCENERQCRHPGFNTLRIPSHDAAASEAEIYITFALKCRSCYELFDGVHSLNEHVKAKHANLIRLHRPPPLASGMICYPPPPPPTSSAASPFKNGARPELLHCPSDCICRVGIRSTDSPMQRAQMLQRCPNFMRRLEKIEAAAYEVYTCTLCKSTFLMKDEVVEHLMKMHEVACKFPCTKCLASFRSVQLQEAHHCSETTIRDLDKLLNIVIMPTDKAHDASKFEDSSNDELGPMKTTPPPAVPSASTPLNGLKRKNGVVIQRLTRFLAMQPPKKPRLEASAPGTPVTSKKRQKTPCPKCQKKFAYRKSLNDHIIFEHIIPRKADEASKNMAVELLRLVNNGATDHAKIEELATALGKYTDDEGTSLKKLTMMDEQENWNEAQRDGERDLIQCVKCKVGFRMPNTANFTRRSNHQRTQSPIPQLCERCDPTRRRRNNGHKFNNAKSPVNGDQVRYTYECEQCGESFPTTIELNSHKSREHSTRPSDAALKCDSCSKIFYSSRMLEKHKKLQHDASASHDDDINSLNSSRAEDDESMDCSLNSHSGVMDTSKDSEAAMNDTANSSMTSRRDSSDGNNKDEEEACKCPRCDFSAEKVSLKNHLKREHGAMAFICQFCGKLLVEISEVRHMLDYHIKSSRKNSGVAAALGCGDEVSELLRTLGKKRLQSLMIYHDFEGKCNNAIMRCPICPEQFATRESCRHHYQWMHDCTCILCDASFSGGNHAGQHKVAVHNSIASYVWAIQRLVSAIVHGLRLDRAHPSNVLYQEVSMRLDALEQQEIIESEMLAAARASNKTCEENVVVVSEPFLEPVVLSEDQLPGSGNMIEVVIGNDMVVEDSEDNLLENFYLSPNYESSCEQPRILDAGAPIPELEEEEEVVAAVAPMVNTCAAIAMPTTPSITTSNGGILIPTTPVTADTYATSAVFKLRQDNGQEEVVLAITDEDLVTYRDDIGSLAEKLSATCDSLSLEEITTMLRSYFENVGTPQTEEVPVEQQFANVIEPRTQ